MEDLDVAAIGTCYLDINAGGFPFEKRGLTAGTETIGQAYDMVAGGSAVNFCRRLSGLGLSTGFIGLTGTDDPGRLLGASLEREQVKPFIARNPDVQTNVSFNMTSQTGEHILAIAGTANAALRFETVQAELAAAAATVKLLYAGGCFKLTALSPDFARLAALAKEHATALAVDHGRLPANTPGEVLDSVKALVLTADYYFPSKDEFCNLWDKSLKEGLAHLAAEAPQLCVVVKDGANGAHYYEDGKVQHVPARQLEAVTDVTGAGDTFNAGVIRAVLNDKALPEAIQYGCDVAAAVISRAPVPPMSD